MQKAIVCADFLKGDVVIPPSKSVAHRAIICAALSDGKSRISPIDFSDDIKATLNAVESLGAEVTLGDGFVNIDGSRTFSSKNAVIDCGESGSTLRFLIPIASAGAVNAHFTGKGRLPSRPLGTYLSCLPQNGAVFSSDFLPFDLSGKLTCGKYYIEGNISSQFITGLMFALPLLEGDSEIILTSPLESAGYVDITVKTLEDFSVKIEKKENGWFIKGNQQYIARDYTVEGDWSQAAFFMAGGAISGDVSLHGLRFDSLQGDMACIDIFKNFGADIEIRDNILHIRSNKLIGQRIDACQIPDLVPILASASAFAQGETLIYGASRLKIKESNRLKAVCDLINDLGGTASENGEEVCVIGTDSLSGGSANGYNDHRIVMSAAILALKTSGKIEISHANAINKSYPNFFNDFIKLGGHANVINLGQ